MNIYSIYTKGQGEDYGPIVIRQGFSFVAAVFNALWAMYHRMWAFAAVAFTVDIIPLMFRYHHLYDELALVVRVALALIFGFMATEMREYTAKSRGYELSDIVVASSEAEAELKFFERSYKNAPAGQDQGKEGSDEQDHANPFSMYENQEKVKL